MTVHVLRVKDGDYTISISTHTSRGSAMLYLAAMCRGWWEDQGQDAPLPNDLTAIDQYFEFWDGEQTWKISENELDPDPSTVDHSKEFADYVPEED